ncbi:MAG: hypothetical protein ACYCPT_03935 [Acidimicrobiales bacterium]
MEYSFSPATKLNARPLDPLILNKSDLDLDSKSFLDIYFNIYNISESGRRSLQNLFNNLKAEGLSIKHALLKTHIKLYILNYIIDSQNKFVDELKKINFLDNNNLPFITRWVYFLDTMTSPAEILYLILSTKTENERYEYITMMFNNNDSNRCIKIYNKVNTRGIIFKNIKITRIFAPSQNTTLLQEYNKIYQISKLSIDNTRAFCKLLIAEFYKNYKFNIINNKSLIPEINNNIKKFTQVIKKSDNFSPWFQKIMTKKWMIFNMEMMCPAQFLYYMIITTSANLLSDLLNGFVGIEITNEFLTISRSIPLAHEPVKFTIDPKDIAYFNLYITTLNETNNKDPAKVNMLAQYLQTIIKNSIKPEDFIIKQLYSIINSEKLWHNIALIKLYDSTLKGIKYLHFVVNYDEDLYKMLNSIITKYVHLS